MSDLSAADLTTLPCPDGDCDFAATGPEKGRGSAAFKLGIHRYRVHGYRNPDGSNAKRKAAKEKRDGTAVDVNTRPVMAIVTEIGDGIGKSKRAPSEEELTRAFGKGISITSIGVASYAAETDPTIEDGQNGEAQRDALVDYLSLPPKAANDLMAPIGRLVAGTTINKRYGRTIVNNVDAVASVSELVKLGLHWRRYFRERDARMIQMGLRIAPDGTKTAVMVGAPFAAPSPAAPSGSTTARTGTPDGVGPDLSGKVWTAEEVQAMAARA